MKRVLFFLMITLMTGVVVAQPKKSRQQQTEQQGRQQSKKQSQNQGMSMRARLMFPTAISIEMLTQVFTILWNLSTARSICSHISSNWQ